VRIIGHIIAVAFGDLFKAVGIALVSAAIGAGAVLAYSNFSLHTWPPHVLTDVVAAIIAVLAAYAGATTVVLRTISRTVFGAAKAVGEEIKKEV
jgi:flagellar motor component MotA